MSSARGVRSSNMELLRIVAMLLVMIDHAGFLALGVPQAQQLKEVPLQSFCIFLSQGLSTVCVNVFVLLSGWFAIHFEWSKLRALLFQTLYFAALVFFALLAINPSKYANVACASTVLCLNSSDYWFIKSYVMLFLFAPMLNAYVERVSEKQLRGLLIAFYIFQTIYGWLVLYAAQIFNGGYSVVSFVGLYLLARYVRLYGGNIIKYSWRVYLAGYLLIGLLLALMAWCVTRAGLMIAGRLFTYTNPLVILQSLLLLLAFGRMTFQSRVINWLACSTVAVYLLHANELLLRAHYGRIIKEMYDATDGVLFVCLVSLFIAAIFVLAVLLDKLRLAIWSFVVGRKRCSEAEVL